MDIESFRRLARRKGVRSALVALAWLMVGALLTATFQKAVERIVTVFFDSFNATIFTVNYPQGLATPEGVVVTPIATRDVQSTRLDLNETYFKAYGPPGPYRVQIWRTVADQRETFVQAFQVEKKGDVIDLKTGTWITPPRLTTITGVERPADPLSETRFNALPDDYGLRAKAVDELGERVLKAALDQVGVVGGGAARDEAKVSAYWSIVPESLRRRAGPATPWGGAFLAWSVQAAGAPPPSRSPSFLAWKDWGEEVPLTDFKPGMIAILQLAPGDVPQAPSNLLVGVALRQRADCTEIIVGNIADRVAITCVHRPLIGLRLVGADEAAE